MRSTFNKIEFWGATFILVLCCYQYMDNYQWMNTSEFSKTIALEFKSRGFQYNYYINYLFPELGRFLATYIAFIFLNSYVVPQFYDKKDYRNSFYLTVATYVFVLYCFIQADILQLTYNEVFDSRPIYHEINRTWFVPLILLGVYFSYATLKAAVLYFLSNPQTKSTIVAGILRDTLVAGVIWMGVFIALVQDHSGRDIAAFWATMFPYAFFLYEMNVYWLLPQAGKNNTWGINLSLKIAVFSIMLYVFPGVIFLEMTRSYEFSLFVAAWMGTSALVIPISLIVYARNKEHYLEMLTLKKNLKATTSNLQFLRSQINPHFLFNALNTLYGTALQEKSERTAQGIQKLGDMMRFMLHENNQDEILIGREIDYIRNYIELQLLRTQTSPDILVETDIPNDIDKKYIAPMLLIPFIENAFKHGISLTHKSWIRINMHTEGNKLYFDIYNSVHQHIGTDPEHDKSGIGLENVKQRLELIYPGKHDLVIRETPQEFFIHLTINL